MGKIKNLSITKQELEFRKERTESSIYNLEKCIEMGTLPPSQELLMSKQIKIERKLQDILEKRIEAIINAT